MLNLMGIVEDEKMKLAIIIPAFNENKTIEQVIKAIPKKINGITMVQIIVIDDGSTDNTAKEALKAGADKVLSFRKNRGLAYAYKEGLNQALAGDADVICSIDADGQYDSTQIPLLIQPIVSGDADIVLGSRFKGKIEEMTLFKNFGNRAGTKIISIISGVPISDAQTGFRAFSREAIIKLNILSVYTHVHETIIQAAFKRFKILEIPIIFRKRNGKSRLIKSLFSYARMAGLDILRTYRDFHPIVTFFIIGSISVMFGLIFGFRVLIHYINTGFVTPYLPSAILATLFITTGFLSMVIGLLADMLRSNRILLEDILYWLKR